MQGNPGCSDINGDSTVNVLDASIVGQSMNTCSGDTNYDSKSDVTGDNCVKQNDMDILNSRFGQSVACAQLISCPDINKDGTVNVQDTTIIGQSWFLCSGQAGYNSGADITKDNCVDNGDMVAANKYFNKPASGIPSCSTGQPDLAAESISHLTEGNTVTVIINYRNAGTAAITSAFGIGFSQPGDKQGTIIEEVTLIGSSYLYPGQVGSAMVKLRYDTPGLYKASFVLDNSNVIQESDETNNVLTQEINFGSTFRKSPCNSYGDVDNDTYVTQEDFTLVNNYLSGATFTEEQKRRADINGDGRVDILDLTAINSYSGNYLDTFSVCSSVSAEGYLNIATIKENYTIGELVELTDPPQGLAPSAFASDANNYAMAGYSGLSASSAVTGQGAIKAIRYGTPYNGYIIEFKEKSVLAKKAELESKLVKPKENELKRLEAVVKETRPKSFIDSINPIRAYRSYAALKSINALNKSLAAAKADVSNAVEAQKSIVAGEHNTAKAQLRSMSAIFSGEKNVLGEYRDVFNGIALNVSDAKAKELKRQAFVKNIYPNYIVNVTLSDSVSLIGADDVWQMQDTSGDNITGRGVTVAVIDTGIYREHPDFKGKAIIENDFVPSTDPYCGDGDDDALAQDDNGHGTHVAGIVAANGQLKGVAPDASLMIGKVLGGQLGCGYNSWIIQGIEWAVDPNHDGDFSDGANVISMSLGGPGNPDDPQSSAVDTAVSNGVVVVVAAGNSGPDEQTIGSPGTAKKAITVGATDKYDSIAYFSSRGPVVWENGSIIKPDIVAPGVDICSAQYDSVWNDLKCFDDAHVAISGTSMATPHVSGVVALLKQAHPDWTPEEIKMALRATAINLGQDINAQGYGRIDALNAVSFTGIPAIAWIGDAGKISNSIIDITGTAAGREFSFYVLSIGRGSNPSSWEEIKRSSVPVTGSILFSGLDSSILDEGVNFIKLDVYNTNGEMVEDREIVLVDNINIKEPLNNDVYRLGEMLKIFGNVTGNFNNFWVEYGYGANPTEWLNDGVALTDGGKSQITGVIAVWNTSVINRSGYYTLRIIVNNSMGKTSSEYTKNIYFDPSLKEGWPVKIAWDSEEAPRSIEDWYWAGFLEPVVSDIDRDGKKEIIVLKGGIPSKIMAYKHDGSLLWAQNVGPPFFYSSNYWYPLYIPLVGDIDSDGYMEIIALSVNQTEGYLNFETYAYAFNHDGSLLWSRPAYTSSSFDMRPTMLMADLDLDSKKEIVIKSSGFNVTLTVLNNDGITISQRRLYAKSWGGSVESTPAIGNFDNDPELEIVFAGPAEGAGGIWENGTFKGWNNTGIIYVLNMDGSVVPGWPVYTDGVIFSSPVVADMNNDSKQDIIVGLMFGDNFAPNPAAGGVYVFDRTGSVLPGWPFEKGWNFWSTPAIGDMDGDGNVELSASRLGFVTYLVHHNGTLVSGWPQNTAWNDYYSTLSGDIDNDGSPDILSTAGNGFYPNTNYHGGVYAWNRNGTPINGFPKVTDFDAQAPAVVDDIDGDGKLELIASSDFDYDMIQNSYKKRGTIYVWELGGAYNVLALPWPMFMHDPQHTGCYDCNKELESQPFVKSLINNTGTTPISGYLFMKVQKLENSNWVDKKTVVDDLAGNVLRTIPPNTYLALDTIWAANGGYVASEKGTFRVYAEFRNSTGGVISTKDGALIGSYIFGVN